MPYINKKYLIIFVAILFALFSSFFYYKIRPEKIATEPLFSAETKFSRLTFFNTKKIRARLDMPEAWEGEYRLQESGNEVKFLSIINPSDPKLLFIIKVFDLNEWEKNNAGWVFLAKKNESIYAYELSTVIKPKTDVDKKYNKMLAESSEILKRFELD